MNEITLLKRRARFFSNKGIFRGILRMLLEDCRIFAKGLQDFYKGIRPLLSYGSLKEQGHVPVNKPIISIIYIVAHKWSLCSAQILVDGVNPQESYIQKSTNISAIVQHI